MISNSSSLRIHKIFSSAARTRKGKGSQNGNSDQPGGRRSIRLDVRKILFERAILYQLSHNGCSSHNACKKAFLQVREIPSDSCSHFLSHSSIVKAPRLAAGLSLYRNILFERYD